jgi:hypothetical protein
VIRKGKCPVANQPGEWTGIIKKEADWIEFRIRLAPLLFRALVTGGAKISRRKQIAARHRTCGYHQSDARFNYPANVRGVRGNVRPGQSKNYRSAGEHLQDICLAGMGRTLLL